MNHKASAFISMEFKVCFLALWICILSKERTKFWKTVCCGTCGRSFWGKGGGQLFETHTSVEGQTHTQHTLWHLHNVILINPPFALHPKNETGSWRKTRIQKSKSMDRPDLPMRVQHLQMSPYQRLNWPQWQKSLLSFISDHTTTNVQVCVVRCV